LLRGFKSNRETGQYVHDAGGHRFHRLALTELTSPFALEATPRLSAGAWLRRYGVAVAAVLAAALIKALLLPVFDAPTGLFYLAVATAAWYGGLMPGLFAALLSLAVSDWWFGFDLFPLGQLGFEAAMRIALFVVVSTVLSLFCEALHRSRRRAEAAARESLELERRRRETEAAAALAQQRALEERERLLATTREALLDAEQAARLKDEFLATVSHELRNPLNAIVGWAHVLQNARAMTEAEQRRALESIVRSAKTQARLVDDLLDVARVVSGKLRLNVDVVNLHQVVEAAIGAAAPQAERKGVRLQSLLEAKDPVLGDAARLQQVVFNLLDNAIKFTPAGGRVQIVTRRPNSHVELTVTDTGEGIAADFLPHIFDLFRQADAGSRRRHGGLGLGLAIARQLIEQHGGSLTASSPGPDQGSRFTITLPVALLGAPSDGPAPGEEPCAIPGVDLKGVVVLVLEDDRDTRELIASILGDCGAEVVLTATVGEAIDRVAAAVPDVILSDIEMPGENGYDFIRRLRALPAEQGGGVPAAALTAYARGEDRRRALAAGFQLHAAKPIEPAELVTIVSNLAARGTA
jgi:signal transduction histidine kinase/CheY-like chemotaxis protein